jgi:hypothetical protein
MLTRRTLLTSGVLAGTGRDQGSSSRETDEKVVKVLEDIREQMRLDSGASVPALGTIRLLQRDFLKGRGKFPDFIDVGIDVWEALLDWHVRTRQVPQVTRVADGRYAMAVFQTNLILRHDVQNNYIGQPYDAK